MQQLLVLDLQSNALFQETTVLKQLEVTEVFSILLTKFCEFRLGFVKTISYQFDFVLTFKVPTLFINKK
jgi:hypothetical protein